MLNILFRYGSLTAPLIAFVCIGCWYVVHNHFFGAFASASPLILTEENTRVTVEQTTNGDGGVCISFEPQRVVRDFKHAATMNSALRLAEAATGHPVQKLIMSVMGDGCPRLAHYRIVFDDPHVDPALTDLLRPRSKTAPR